MHARLTQRCRPAALGLVVLGTVAVLAAGRAAAADGTEVVLQVQGLT
jgi:hypothetical protein